MTIGGNSEVSGKNEITAPEEKKEFIDSTRRELIKLKGHIPNNDIISLEGKLGQMHVDGLKKLNSEIGAIGQRELVVQASWKNGLIRDFSNGRGDSPDKILSDLKLT